jgi:hypothetical protein
MPNKDSAEDLEDDDQGPKQDFKRKNLDLI